MNARTWEAVGLLAIVIFLLGACGFSFVRGSGNLVTESRQVGNFDRVELSGIGQVFITQGEQASLTVETDDNLMQYISTTVRGGTLHLGFERGVGRVILPSQLTFNLVVVDLEGLAVSGSGRIDADRLAGDRLDVRISGSGEARVASLTAEDVEVHISGSGNVALAGEVTGQAIDISGSGNYAAGNLRSEEASVEISGSGEATIWVTDSLDAQLSGSGSVNYYGTPALNTSTSGSGRIRNLSTPQPRREHACVRAGRHVGVPPPLRSTESRGKVAASLTRPGARRSEEKMSLCTPQQQLH